MVSRAKRPQHLLQNNELERRIRHRSGERVPSEVGGSRPSSPLPREEGEQRRVHLIHSSKRLSSMPPELHHSGIQQTPVVVPLSAPHKGQFFRLAPPRPRELPSPKVGARKRLPVLFEENSLSKITLGCLSLWFLCCTCSVSVVLVPPDSDTDFHFSLLVLLFLPATEGSDEWFLHRPPSPSHFFLERIGHVEVNMKSITFWDNFCSKYHA